MRRLALLSLSLFSSMVFCMGLAACSNEGQHQADNGNADFARMNDINTALLNKNVLLQTKEGYESYAVTLSDSSFDKMSNDDLTSVRGLLTEYISRSDDAMRIMSSGEVTSSGNTDDVGRYQANAKALIKDIDKRLGKKSQKKSTTSES